MAGWGPGGAARHRSSDREVGHHAAREPATSDTQRARRTKPKADDWVGRERPAEGYIGITASQLMAFTQERRRGDGTKRPQVEERWEPLLASRLLSASL